MYSLSKNSTLADVQRYVQEMEAERGFTSATILQQCLLLGEEVGELFKAIRKQENFSLDKNSPVGNVDEELTDILIFLCSIANRSGIDLEDAFRKKEALNETRAWN